jgi:cytochrome c oxidase cbb3-type subunit 1
MLHSLNATERLVGMALAISLAVIGFMMAAFARPGPMAIHGVIAGILGLVAAAKLDDAQPTPDRAHRYYDAPTRFGLAMTLIWGVIAMGVGVWLAALMYWPEATPAGLGHGCVGHLRNVMNVGGGLDVQDEQVRRTGPRAGGRRGPTPTRVWGRAGLRLAPRQAPAVHGQT